MSAYEEDAAHKAEDAMTQIARLREQVEALMREKVAPALEGAAEQAGAAVRARADELAEAVRDRPLTALAIAAVSGFLIGRLCR